MSNDSKRFAVSRHGLIYRVLHTRRLHHAHRVATKAEIEYFEQTGDAVAANAKRAAKESKS